MENSLKGLLLAAGTIITCIVFYRHNLEQITVSSGSTQYKD